MHARLFGRTGHTVGEIGLGCWQLGGTDWTGISDMRARSILTAAADSGVNFFDTADVYGSGRSEEVLGQFLRDRKEHFLVATKVGRASGMYPSGYTWDAIRTATEASLKRLGIPCLHLTQLHCVPADVLKQGEIFEWVRQLKTEGKIRDFGVSVETIEEALLCLQQPGLASLQLIYNVLRQEPAREVFPLAVEKGVAVIVRLPLADGLLGGHLTGPPPAPSGYSGSPAPVPTAPADDAVTFCGLPMERGLQLSAKIQSLVPHGMTLPQLALRFVLDHQAVSVVIPGSGKPAHAASNALATSMAPLAPALREQLQILYKNEVAPFIQGPL
jgi:aryl-alcohol dehydrogenase-like predicted oxidoreductase